MPDCLSLPLTIGSIPPNSSWMRSPSSVTKTTLRVSRGAAGSIPPGRSRRAAAAIRTTRRRHAPKRSGIGRTFQIGPGVEIEENLIVIPRHLQDPLRPAADDRLESFVRLANLYELGEQARLEERRVAAPAVERRHQNRASSGSAPLGSRRVEKRVEQSRRERLV